MGEAGASWTIIARPAGLIPKHNWHQWKSPFNIGLPSRRRCIPLDEAVDEHSLSAHPNAGPSQSVQVRVRRGAPSGHRVSQAARTFDLNTGKWAAARTAA